jgi:formylmethanofuran dehydrogenase subunit E
MTRIMVPSRFEKLLDESVALHGHLCAGQVIGVRMAMLALTKLGINDPKGRDRKKLYVVVEIDRCATDAIQSVTGCSLGKRTMRHEDLGIMAATFINLLSSQAIRVIAKEESRELSKKYYPEILDKYRQQLLAYKVMPDDDLFSVQDVHVSIPEEDLPGKPLSRVVCHNCGDWVQDRREIMQDGRILCRGCARGKYYRRESE